MRPTFLKMTAKTAMLLAAIILFATGTALAQQDVYLSAQRFSKQLPGNQNVPMWGFALCDQNWACAPPPTAPGPQINVPAGTSSLVVHVQNMLTTEVSFMIQGQPGGGAGSPVIVGGRVRSFVPEVAPGATGTYTFLALRPGTYLYESGTYPSVQVPMGLYGAVTVQAGPNQAYPVADATFDAEAVALFSEVDPVQNATVDAAANPAGYPSTVNYKPTFFLINGVAFDKTAPGLSTISAGTPANGATQWRVLLRLVNAGSQSHAPLALGLNLTMLAEDGNVLPDRRQQADFLLGAGKATDAIVLALRNNDGTFDRTYPFFDRMMRLTSATTEPDSGMLAYLQVGAGSEVGGGAGSGPTAVDDAFSAIKNTPLTCSNPVGDLCNILTNDSGLSDVKLVSGPKNGTLALNADGTYTYTPNTHFAGSDSFTYTGNTVSSNVAVVALSVSFAQERPVAADDGPFTNTIGTQITVAKPGVLGNDTEFDGDKMTAVAFGTPLPGLTLNSDGSFSFTGAPGDYTFQYKARDSHGNDSITPATVALHVREVSNLALTVTDATNGQPITAYRWLVEEDTTFHAETPVPTSQSLATRFHASYMPVVAQGCVGGPPICSQEAPISQVVLDNTQYHFISVLPNDAGDGGHSNGGVQLKPGQTSATVLVNPQPIATAQLSVFVFEDNSPTNGDPDGNERGLGGFQITLYEAGGRYGANGGQVSFDGFGNPIKNALPCAPYQPEGVILTCPDGTALIQNLAPAKYTIFVDSPAGAPVRWVQTSTIEGTRGVDAWVKSGEAPYLREFGPPGYHVFVGFVSPDRLPNFGTGANTVSGKVTNLHIARPPDVTQADSGTRDALAHTTCWVGLNSAAGLGPIIAAQQCDGDGNFSMSNIPDGTYQLVVWDTFLDQIINFSTVILPSGGNLGTLPVNNWFNREEHNVFVDNNHNGIWDSNESPLPDAPVMLRFRDGSVYQFSTTDNSGYYSFDETFPFFNWLVAEADPLNRKSTGVTITIDAGGPVDAGGILNPQIQSDGQPFRVDLGPVKAEAFQGFAGQTNQFNWGRAPFNPGETGGITGLISYASTRSEDDPRMAAINTWEPNIARVKVRLYKEVPTDTGGIGLVYVTETYSSSWDDALPTSCPGEDPSSIYTTQSLGGDVTRCYDGNRNFNQVRPGVYDGRYSFSSIPAGNYVIEVVLPPGYELVKEEDKNVFIGDAYVAPVSVVTPVFGVVAVLPDQALIQEAIAPSPGVANPACVGDERVVPDFLSLFPTSAAPFAGALRPLCDRKEVILSDQSTGYADFHLFTSTPIATHYAGMLTDDLSNEFDLASPNYGEKYAPPYLPISFKEFNGREITRVYGDQWGRFNGLLPSTYNANVPLPSGYGPKMLVTCINDPAIPGPNGTFIPDPQYNPQYTNVCYTLQYMPGTTTYIDAPVLPISAFASGNRQADCAYPDHTPAIRQVNGDGVGPFLSPSGNRALTITARGLTEVPNPAYIGPSGTQPKTITRDFGFGDLVGTVTLGGVPLSVDVGNWSSSQIIATVSSNAATGELVVTRGDNGKSTVTGITITVEDTTPVRVAAGGSIQAAIDGAAPGSLILIEPGVYDEVPVMWKPLRLQGAGAGVTQISAKQFPDPKIENWRAKIKSLFDAGTVDFLPGQTGVAGPPIVGPGILGNAEGAGITVVAKNDPTGPNSFLLYPSSIDGLSITGTGTGGGLYVNGYAHNLQISNNDIFGNSGFYNGGVRVGEPFLPGLTGPGPFALNNNVQIHHNTITNNGGTTEGAAGGGISICTGADNYRANYNFICGNFAVGSGAGVGHFGLSTGGEIANNQITFNQSFNQSSNEHGGGIFVGGEPGVGAALTRGAGNVTINANLVQGNQAGAGHGGGIRLQQINGQDVQLSPSNPAQWWQVSVTNNMVADNMAGWAGGGISLQDAALTSILNNTVSNNDSTSTVGATLVAGTTTSTKQVAGIASERHSVGLVAAFAAVPQTENYRVFSNPTLNNNIVWHNRSFNYDGTTGHGTLVPTLTQTFFGECVAGAYHWDLGLVGDTSPAPGALQLQPTYSVLSNTTGYSSTNLAVDPQHAAGYCNGSVTASIAGGIDVAPAVDEGGNFIDVRFGPLTNIGDYHIAATSPARDAGNSPATSSDFDGEGRPFPPQVDIGADEVVVAGLTVTPTSLDFGSQSLAIPSGSRSVTIYYVGSVPLTVNSITIGGANPSDFAQNNTCGAILPSGSTCAISVTFTPTAAGGRSATLVIDTSDPAQPQVQVSLAGTGLEATASLDRTALSFATRSVGTTSAPQDVMLSNAGPGTLAISGIVIGGANPGDFSNTATCAATLAPGTSCTISVRFTPTAVGARAATLSINNSDPVNPQLNVSLTGTATGGGISITPLSLAFGNQLVNTFSAYQLVQVTNTGNSPLLTLRAAFTGVNASEFTRFTLGVLNNCTLRLNPGLSCNIAVRFRPTATGARSATMNVLSNDPSNPSVPVALSGTGIQPAASISPNPVDFGAVPVFTAVTQTVTLTNSGTAPLTVNNVLVSGVNFTKPAAADTCRGTTLQPGASCTVDVRFRPTLRVARAGTLRFVDNAPDSPQIVPLSGTGQ